MIPTSIRFILVLLIGLAAKQTTLNAAEVLTFDCSKTGPATSDCIIKLIGEIQSDEVLYLAGVSDIDEAFLENAKIGSTGYFYTEEFYAHFIPRLYPLGSYQGKKNINILVRCKSLLGVAVGLSKSGSSVTVISGAKAFKIRLRFYLKICITLMIFGALLALGFRGFTPLESDGWAWTPNNQRIFWFSATTFIASMSELPRIVIPNLITGDTYVLVHGLVESIVLFGLSELLSEVQFSDDARIIKRTNNALIQIFKKYLSRIGIAGAICILLLNRNGRYVSHSTAVIFQTFSFVLVTLISTATLDWSAALKRSLVSGRFYAFFQIVTVSVMVRDAIIYKFFHDPSQRYGLPYCLILVLLAAALRLTDIWLREIRSNRKSLEIAASIEWITEIQSRLNAITDSLFQDTKAWSERITLAVIKEGECFIATSAGPGALNVDQNARPVGGLLLKLIEKGDAIYVTDKSQLTKEFPVLGLSRACLAIPIRQGGEIIAAITIMAKHGFNIPAGAAYDLKLRTLHLKRDITSETNLLIAMQQAEQAKAYTICRSGIIYENVDAFGRIKEISDEKRRVFISADGLQTTSVSEDSKESKLIRDVFTSYKMELFSVWFALRDAFEFISKDTRGDDLWCLSPTKFRNEYLQTLGPERAAIYLGFFIEKHARIISDKPEFQLLGLAGAHVAVGAGLAKTITLGTVRSRCVDVDSAAMSRITKIRSAADPGSIIVEESDIDMSEAIKKVSREKFDVDMSKNFSVLNSDLKRLPRVVTILSVEPDSNIQNLEAAALVEATKSLRIEFKKPLLKLTS